MEIAKRCTQCLISKSLIDYYKDARSLDGRAAECKKCHNIKTSKWRKNNPLKSNKISRDAYRKKPLSKRREIWLKREHGITLEHYEKLYKEQDGKCAICKKVQDKSMNVDHNHITGKIRGLLCNKCNRGIGYLDDSYVLVENAALYLRKNE